MARDDFRVAVKRELALRAAHFCSNPRCLKLTAGPRSDPARALLTGHAAHINAASAEGPRFDRRQSIEERRSAANGLWLCRECGDIVDKDQDGHDAALLRAWKASHEAMIAEVRLEGYSRSLELLRAGRMQPDIARQILALVEDRRVFWAAFDAECPDRVRLSLDGLRHDLTRLRGQCVDGTPIDNVLVSLGQTIRRFFDQMESIDLTRLRCDFGNPDWRAFEAALLALRKSVLVQLASLARAYGMSLAGELAEVCPELPMVGARPV